MELYIFNKEDSNEIGNYNSISAFYSKILKTEEATNIGFIHIDPDGIVGYHEAPVPQLFIVVQGEGWVAGEDEKRINLKSGEGVLWNKGEGHSSGSKMGMTALVIQSKNLPIPSK
ncbi:cupin domain-containing protein [Bacillus sp. NPDC094106]|uniref:cupin domain-containing protein n=1 Tax=Bacillus sp. NPDC094106 TaxID=3363949 RepID=UPI00380E51B8